MWAVKSKCCGMNVKCFPYHPRILLVSWASWMMYALPCMQWARVPTRPCCRSSESRSTPTNTSTAGTRASSSITTLARSVWAHTAYVFGGVSSNLHHVVFNKRHDGSHPKFILYKSHIGHKYIFCCLLMFVCIGWETSWITTFNIMFTTTLCNCLCCGVNCKLICYGYSPQ